MKIKSSNFGAQLIAFCACLALFLKWTPVGAANILAVQPIAAKSQWNVLRAVLQALTDHGHTVTVFTPFPDGDRDGYTEIDVSGDLETRIGLNASLIMDSQSMSTVVKLIVNMTRAGCRTVFKHQQMQKIFDCKSQVFDVVVAGTVSLDYVSYVATVLQIPAINVISSSVVLHSKRSFFEHFQNPTTTSSFLFWRSVPKTFADRFANSLHLIYSLWLLWREERWHRQIEPQSFDAVDLVKPSLTFTNTHLITKPSSPLSPDVVQIGGIHLAPPRLIPKDILEFIDDAPHGVIFFTLGSMILMSSLPENVLNVFRESFSQIPQKVLWKYEGDMKNISKNVMTQKWFPQRDILLHPNVKLFISHGGISGMYETVDAGVPVLGFPYIYDQPRNIDNLVNAGMAISMDIDYVNKDTFLKAVLEIVNDEKYRKNAKIASERFKDRPMSPADSVVYWTEYVLRHNGAPHLKSQALNLTWYQYFLIDVISTFLFIAFIVLFIIYRVSKIICKHFLIFVYKRKVKSE
uniref:UDP-glucuronosyltransferase n=1 Tax=Melanaphis sacchari TaxID=742174 RepID=A0A2H8TFP8_9HEMI